MEDIFFNSNYSDFGQTLFNLLIFITISGVLIYVIYFVLSKILFKKSKQRKEIQLRLTFLWALFIFFLFFNVYIFILFYKIGSGNIEFMAILPQILIYILLIILFFIKRHSLKKIINVKSLN